MATYKSFNEFWGVGLGRTCFTDYEAVRAEKVWNAAIKHAEEKFTSTNTGSLKLPTLNDTLIALDRYMSGSVSVKNSGVAKFVYDFICRQLRAGA